MGITLNDNLITNAPKPSDSRYFNGLIPRTSVSEVNTALTSSVRYRGLTVNISGVEYWYKAGITDGELIIKDTQPTYYTDYTVYINSTTGNDTTGTGAIGAPRATIDRAFRDKVTMLGTNTYYLNLTGAFTISATTMGLMTNNIRGHVYFTGNTTTLLSSVTVTRTSDFDFTSSVDLGVNTYKDKWMSGAYPIFSANGTSAKIAVNTSNLTGAITDVLTTIAITTQNINYTCGRVTFDKLTIPSTLGVLYSTAGTVLIFNRCKITAANYSYMLDQSYGGESYFGLCVLNLNGGISRKGKTYVANCVVRLTDSAAFAMNEGEITYFSENMITGGAASFYVGLGGSLTGRCVNLSYYENQTAIISANSNTNLRFYSYPEDVRKNIKVSNVAYFIKFPDRYEAGEGVANISISDSKTINGTFTTGLIDHRTITNFKYINLDKGVNINIAGTYPEIDGNKKVTLSAATSSYLNIGSSTENRVIEVTYNITRGTEYRSGRINLLNNGTTVQLIEDKQQTSDIGITFDSATIVAGVIQLNYTTTAGASLTMNYTVTRQMIF